MHNTKCTCSTETLGIHTCIRVRVPRKEFAINLLQSWSAARMHMQHRDTWNPHLYSGTGTSQRVCHQPASKLECRTNVNELSTSGSIPRCLLTKMPHAVPFHGGGFVCILYKDTVGGWQWPGSRNRLLSEPFALGTVCSRNRALQRRVCRRAGSAFPETSADGTEQALGALLLCALALAVRAPFVGGGQFSTKSQKVPIAVLSQRSGLLKLGL